MRKTALLVAAMLVWMATVVPALANTDAIEVYYLPMNEAAEAVSSQLSADGKVAIIESRRLLVVDDDEAHIQKIRTLLKKLDTPVPQFVAHVEIEDVSSKKVQRALASGGVSAGRLPGGWVRAAVSSGYSVNSGLQAFQLRVAGAEPANIETGTIQPVDRQVLMWLAGYGVVPANSVEMIPVTSGFRVQAWPVGPDAVRVRITPWMQRQQVQVSGQQEMLIDLGTPGAPALPPGNNPNMRLNAAPRLQPQPVIEIRGATTEVTIPLGREVTIAAMDSEARNLGAALLSGQSTVGARSFAIRLRMSRE